MIKNHNFPVLFETVTYISPIRVKQWDSFIKYAADRIRNKSGSIFEIDEEKKRITIRRQSIPLEKL